MKRMIFVLSAIIAANIVFFAAVILSGSVYHSGHIKESVPAGYVTYECRIKQEKAYSESANIRSQRDAVNAEINNENASLSANLPTGYYESLPDVPKSAQKRLDGLYIKYRSLDSQVEAIESKYACN